MAARGPRAAARAHAAIGILLAATADDAEFQAWVGAFLQALALLGWTIGRNVRIDTRWAGAKADDIRKHAAELAALALDLHPERRCRGLDDAELAASGALGGIPKDRRSRHVWCGLLEQFQPFRADAPVE